MKVLILEDNSMRMRSFKKIFFNYEIHHAKHAREAIEFLCENVYDLITLDHDLGGTELNYNPEDCGSIVAEYISRNPVKSQVIIHSYNNAATTRMLSLIPQAMYIPGLWTKNIQNLKKMINFKTKEE